ncbi:MAG: hypothetical protein D6730_07950 [Bacteroidetes bacterium]|nr:MAG: hypothetical protein D6730_07950 [Bacteroidota bacterium]
MTFKFLCYFAFAIKNKHFMENESLIQQAWAQLEEGDSQPARELGEQLIAAGKQVGYLLKAASLEQEEDWEAAIRILSAGTEAHPGSWELWLSLGNMQVNLENWEAALAAYGRAAACPQAASGIIELHKAVAYTRMLDFDQALNTLQALVGSEVRNSAFLQKIELLHQLGHHKLILELVEEELESLAVPEDEEEAREMSRICSCIASACWYEEESEEMIQHYLKQAIEYDRTNPENLLLLREMAADFSDQARLYELLLKGKWQEEEGRQASEFFCAYEVVADSQEEALAYIRAYEPEPILKDSLEIVEVDTSEAEEDEPKGIYVVTDLAFVEIE